MRGFVLLVPLILLAGCTQLDDAKQAAADAQVKLDEAKREAEEAQARYDRVKSATIVREEQLRVVVVPMSNETTIWFDAAAARGEFLVPSENVTSLPAIRVRFAGGDISCDPLDCRLAKPVGDVNVTWADGAEGGITLVDGNVSCATEDMISSYCRIGELSREGGRVLVTTSASDLTD